MEQNLTNKIKQTERFMIVLWAFFLIVLYVCSFLTEYHYPHKEEEIVVGRKILSDCNGYFFSH